MADIIEEIVNDQKDQKRQYYFMKLLPYVIVGTITIAILILGYTYYEKGQKEHNQQIGNMLFNIVDGNIEDQAMIESSLNSIAANSKNRQEELARLEIASRKADNIEEALMEFSKIAENKAYLDITRAYARLRWLNIILDIDKLDEAKQMQARKFLHFFNDENKPFYASAMLYKALFYYKNNEMDLATDAANELLKLANASRVLKEQANALLISIKYKK